MESKFQANLIQELKTRFPGSIVTKSDPGYIQGLPDLLILYKNKWGALECKKEGKHIIKLKRHHALNYNCGQLLWSNIKNDNFSQLGKMQKVLKTLCLRTFLLELPSRLELPTSSLPRKYSTA